MRRILCMRLPDWPLQRRRLAEEIPIGEPVALAEPAGARGWQVVIASPEAVREGVRPGMPVAEALSLFGSDRPLSVHRHDPAEDRRRLAEFAERCRRFTPVVGLEEGESPQCLWLDITGCARVFGGEDPLARRVARFVRRLGLDTRLAVADTAGAAWGLARFASDSEPILVEPGKALATLRSLPPAALRLSPETLTLLSELGIESVAALERLPRAELAERFGSRILERFDQAIGQRFEPIVPAPVILRPAAQWPFETPVDDRRVLETVLPQLLDQLLEQIEANQGIEAIECRFTLESPSQPIDRLATLPEPTRQSRRLLEAMFASLESLRSDSAIAAIRLEAVRFGPLAPVATELFESQDAVHGRRSLERLADRLAGRLGRRAVLRAYVTPDPQPERSFRFEPYRRDARSDPLAPFVGDRPMRRLARPRPIDARTSHRGAPLEVRWAGRSRNVLRAWGPERIETGWWRGQPVRRDYYRLETAGGPRIWAFRRLDDEQWFLDGWFD